MNLAKSWLEECVNFHGTLYEEPSESNDYERIAPQDLRVIDVQHMCLVMLTPRGRKKISEENLLESKWDDPRHHSLHSNQEKEAQILQMDRVYQGSLITIISASPLPKFKLGYDCLPRYHAGTRFVEEITDQRNTIQSTRAWTFQEELLSQRRLYFTPAQLYFQCSCGVFYEDAVDEVKSPSAYVYESCSLWNASGLYTNATNCSAYRVTARDGLSRVIFKSQEESFSFYMDVVERYTCRSMSNQGDAVIALEGVLEVLRKTTQTNSIWGLPESLFDDALL
ncbi:uncharacterized protein PAC_00285 [Phialocephala subalpina]|uniref:Heterokaryon incompatibility domain-containing protein n=1 Tax=Phialocephala subalpina TaxID=576137 RepID=A0A1L7WCA7_9HELO|nr:uncharacterized protein PAC_00285 [Phialocephala subalpina]